MVREKFAVRLMPEERNQLEHMVRAGMNSARVTTRARILLKTDEGWSAPKVAQHASAIDILPGASGGGRPGEFAAVAVGPSRVGPPQGESGVLIREHDPPVVVIDRNRQGGGGAGVLPAGGRMGRRILCQRVRE